MNRLLRSGWGPGRTPLAAIRRKVSSDTRPRGSGARLDWFAKKGRALYHELPMQTTPYATPGRPAPGSDAHHDQDPGRTGKDARRRPPGGRRAGHDRAARDARRDHRGAGPALPRLHRRRAACRAGEPELPRLSEDDLHVGQPRRLPRHPERQEAEGRRHRQHRRDGDPRRLPRRHQPHVLRRQAAGACASGSRAPASRPCGTASTRCARARASATSATRSRCSPKRANIPWCASTAATASAASTTRIRRCCTTASRTPASCCGRA